MTTVERKHGIISADCHVDPEWLPRDLFTSRFPSRLQDTAPKVVETPEGNFWMSGDKRLGPWGPRPGTYGKTVRTRAMLAGGFNPEQFRPTNPEYRIEDQERDGYDAEVMYGPLRRWRYLSVMDQETAVATVQAYNEWLADFCSRGNGRLYGLGGVTADGLEDMIAELKHIKDLGLVGAEVPFQDPQKPVSDHYWEPLWAAADEFDVPVHIHVPLFSSPSQVPADVATALVNLPLKLGPIITGVILGGVFDRHPKAKVVIAESGTGWIPYLLDRLDYEWENAHDSWKEFTPTLPSEVFREHIYATFQEDSIGPKLADMYPDNFMWGSDYPHTDGVWPDSHEVIEHTMGKLEPELRQKIIEGNARRVYNLS